MNTNSNDYKIQITGEDFHFEQKIDDLKKSRIIAFLNLPNVSSVVAENYSEQANTVAVPTNTSNVSASPNEFILDKNAVTNPQKIAVFLMYIEDILFQEAASREQIKDLFEKSKQKMPTNFARDFDMAIRSGWISPANEQGKYYLTVTGRNIILKGFADSVKVSRKNISHKNGFKKNKLEIREEVENLNVDSESEIPSDYWSLKKGDKILWLLTLADLHGINDINYKELARLAEKKHDNIPAKSITALVEFHLKNNKIAIPLVDNIRRLRILKPGIDDIMSKNELDNSNLSRSSA